MIESFAYRGLVYSLQTCTGTAAGMPTYVFITHAHSGSTFWHTYYRGLSSSLPVTTSIRWITTAYNHSRHADEVAIGCELASAMAITVPYPTGSEAQAVVHAAIDACIARRPELPIFITNTDTYSNTKTAAYVVGSPRFDFACAPSINACSTDRSCATPLDIRRALTITNWGASVAWPRSPRT